MLCWKPLEYCLAVYGPAWLSTNVENHMCFYLSTKIEIFVALRDPFIEVSIILAGSIL